MGDKTKTELLAMLAEAVRNTQAQPTAPTQSDPISNAQPRQKRARPASKRTSKPKHAPTSARRKRRRS